VFNHKFRHRRLRTAGSLLAVAVATATVALSTYSAFAQPQADQAPSGKLAILYERAAAERTEAINLQGKPEAVAKFAAAAKSFGALADANKAATPDSDAYFLAVLDQAECLLYAGSTGPAEADALLAPVLKSKVLAQGKFAARAKYLAASAAFARADYVAAGKALAEFAPFRPKDSDYALQARYLLARTHQLSGERPEALAQYTAVIASWPDARTRAEEILRSPNVSAAQRTYCESLLRATPEYVTRAMLYSGEILAQTGKNAAAQDLFARLEAENTSQSIIQEAKLFHGVCQLQAKNYGEAQNLLNPLVEHATLGDQARWFAARARAQGADPNSRDYVQIVSAAAEDMLKAADRAAVLAKENVPDANLRRADILLDAGETFLSAHQYDRAADLYARVATEYTAIAPDRAEQALEREVATLHLAGSLEKTTPFDASDAVAKTFETSYPKSTLLGAVAFHEAENAYLRALAAAGSSDPATRKREPEFLAAAAARYQRVIAEFPDISFAPLARAGLGTCQYRAGNFAAAAETLAKIPETERTGELATVSYLIGDCLLRQLPPNIDDALSASRVLDQAANAARLFVAFAVGNDAHPQFAESLLKAALCYQRVGDVLADPLDRRKAFTQSKEMLDRAIGILTDRRPGTPKDSEDLALATIERAKINALLGDPSSALLDLRNFARNDRLKDRPEAPLATLRLASLLRAAGKAPEAADLLTQNRARFEFMLLKDPAHSAWVSALAYEQAVAVKESGKPADARALFEVIAKQYAGTPDGQAAAWRIVQCRRDELLARITAARTLPPNTVPADYGQTIARQVDEAAKALRQSVDAAIASADAVKNFPLDSARLYYEAAWTARAVADVEIDVARNKLQNDLRQGAPVNLRTPEISPEKIPLQPAETLARSLFAKAIDAAPDSDFSARIRFDLAELLARRGESDPAIELLETALALGPADDLADRIRVRLAAGLLARNAPDAGKVARPYLVTVLKNNRSATRGEALYFIAEVSITQNDWAAAVDALSIIRDNTAFSQLPGISDSALFQLSRAQRELSRPDDARASLEQLVARYPNSPLVDEARFLIGQYYGSRKNLDAAVNAYIEITRRSYTQTAGRANYEIGLIRLEQKNYAEAVTALLAVARTPEVIDLTPQAMLKAVDAYVELKKPEEARKLLTRVKNEFPKFASIADKRLTEIK
jgi:cellulose synthase operon protein C